MFYKLSAAVIESDNTFLISPLHATTQKCFRNNVCSLPTRNFPYKQTVKIMTFRQYYLVFTVCGNSACFKRPPTQRQLLSSKNVVSKNVLFLSTICLLESEKIYV